MSVLKPAIFRFVQFWFPVAVLMASHGALLAQSTDATGGGLPYSNIKPTLTLHYVMCYQGAYPGQSNGSLQQTDRSVPIVGEIRALAFSNTPSGFMECYGQVMNISQNVPLFSVLLTNYGGNGVSTFGIPDLRGIVPIGVGQGPALPNFPIGERIGAETVTLSTANLAPHTHTIPSGQTGIAGGAATYSIMQPSLALNYCIDGAGEILLFAGSSAPYGWALCDGSLRQMDVDTTLYDYIGITYGGDGATTFALPDLRGRSPIGTGNNAISGDYVLGQRDGAPAVTLLSATMPLHNHSMPGGVTGNSGGSASFDHRQPTLAMTWLIAHSGNSPDSNLGPPFFGEMRLVAGAAPQANTGWLPATGSLLPISQYVPLFATIGTNYGGNGINTFGVPSQNGRMAASLGNSFTALGTTFDQFAVTLSTDTMPAHSHALPVAPTLTGLQRFGNGAFQFTFTNLPGNTFTVLTATNVALPLSNWSAIATVTNFAPGYYQFTSDPANDPNRFYTVRVP